MLTTHFAPDAAASAMIATRLADSLAKRGHDVWVGAAAPSYRPLAELAGPTHPRVTVRRSGPGRDRLRTYVRYHLAVLGWASALRSADLVLSISPPISLGALAAIIGTGRPTVYNVQDVLGDFLRQSGTLRRGPLLSLLEGFERFTYGRTSALVTVGDSQRRFLMEQGLSAEKVTTIENFADVESIVPLPRDLEYRRALRIPDDAFCALYAGNFGLANDLDLLLDAASSLESHSDIVFVFAGGGREWTRAAEFAQAKRNVLAIGHRPATELARLYASADVGLVTLKRGLSSCSVPSKTYTILASGRPFVAAVDADSDVATIARRSGSGIAVDAGDAQGFAASILQLASDRARASGMGESGSQYVRTHNTPDLAAERYESLFEDLLSKRLRMKT